MGLLGDVGADELEAALKPREFTVFPEGAYPVVVETAEALKQGPKGQYIPLTLSASNESTGEAIKVWFNMSLSPGARKMTIQNLIGFGVDPNAFDDPSQLQGCMGRAYLTIGKDNKGRDRNEVKWIVTQRAAA